MGGDLRAIVGAAEDPDLRARSRPAGMPSPRGTDGPRAAACRSSQHCRSRTSAGNWIGPLVGERVERIGGAAVGARRAAEPEIDAARRQRIEHAELLGDLERRIVRQHHAGAADADARRARGDRRDQDLRRRCRRWCRGCGAPRPRSADSPSPRQPAASATVLRIASPCGAPAVATDWSRTESGILLTAAAARAAVAGHTARDGAAGDRRAPAPSSPRRPARRGCRRRGRGGPWSTISVSLPWRSIVRRGVRIDDVGLTAKRTTIGWPVEMPPRMPPAWFDRNTRLAVRRRSRISSALSSPVSSAARQAGADLDALDRVDAHHRRGEVLVELAVDRRAEARRHALGHDLDHRAGRGAGLAHAVEVSRPRSATVPGRGRRTGCRRPRPSPSARGRSCAARSAPARRGS